jgi:hypothetical protein
MGLLSQFQGGSFSAGKEALAKSGRIPTPPPILPQTSMAGPLTRTRDTKGRFTSTKSITPPANTPPAGPQQSMLSRFGSAGQIAAMAGVLLAFAAAIWILSYAFKNFEEVSAGGFAGGISAMAAFTGMVYALVPALKVLSTTSGSLLPAIGILLAISAAVVGVGYGLSLMGDAFKGANLDKMLAFSTGMLAFAGSVLILAGALSLLGNPASLVGLGVLAGVGVAAVAVGAVGSMFGGNKPNTDSIVESNSTKIDEDNPLITKIQALTDAIKEQPILLYLDNNVIAKTVRKESSKTLAPGKP